MRLRIYDMIFSSGINVYGRIISFRLDWLNKSKYGAKCWYLMIEKWAKNYYLLTGWNRDEGSIYGNRIKIL